MPENELLKYEGKFEVGDLIRAFDCKPRPERYPDEFIEGVVTEEAVTVRSMGDALCMVVDVKHDSLRNRVGSSAYVPLELGCDYDGRVIHVSPRSTLTRKW